MCVRSSELIIEVTGELKSVLQFAKEEINPSVQEQGPKDD